MFRLESFIFPRRHSILDKEHNHAVDNYEQELHALKNKHEAMTEFTKQEAALAAAKSADTIADLEHHVNQLKKSTEDVDTQRQRQIRVRKIYRVDKKCTCNNYLCCEVSMREPPLRKTWEYSNITQPLISYERGWPLAFLEDLIKPNQASDQGAR
jgi:hypothetical protein